MNDVTVILQDLGRGKSAAMEDLLPLAYDALRELAAARMTRVPPFLMLLPMS